MRQTLGSPDLLLITGNLTAAGRSTQFEAASRWLDSLATAAGVKPEQILVVPGPHDLDRDLATKPLVTKALHDLFRNSPAQLDEFLLPGNRNDFAASLWPKFQPFADFSRKFGPPPLSAEAPFWKRALTLPQGKLVVLGLNSCLLSMGGHDQEEVAVLSTGQRHRLLESLPSDALTLALMHHPPAGLLDGEALLVELQKYPHLLLTSFAPSSGSGTSHGLGQKGRLHLSAGDIHSATRESGGHRYTWLRLSQEGLEYHPRLYSPSWSEFRADHASLSEGKTFQHLPLETLPQCLQTWLRLPPVSISRTDSNAGARLSAAVPASASEKERSRRSAEEPSPDELPCLTLHFGPARDPAGGVEVTLLRDKRPVAAQRWHAPDPFQADYGSALFEALFPRDHRPPATERYRLEITSDDRLGPLNPLPGLEYARLAFPRDGFPVTDYGWTVGEPGPTPFKARFSGHILVVENPGNEAHGPWSQELHKRLFTHVESLSLAEITARPANLLPSRAVWVVAEALAASRRDKLLALAVQREAAVVVWCEGAAPVRERLTQVQLMTARTAKPGRRGRETSPALPSSPLSLLSWLKDFLVQLRRDGHGKLDRSFAAACAGHTDELRSGLRLRGLPSHLLLETPDPRVSLDLIFQWYLRIDRILQQARVETILDQGILNRHREVSVQVFVVPGPRGSAPEAFTERPFRPLSTPSVVSLARTSEWALQPREQLDSLYRCLGPNQQPAFFKRLRELAGDEELLVLKLLHTNFPLETGTGRPPWSLEQLSFYLQSLGTLSQELLKAARACKLLVMIPVTYAQEPPFEMRSLEKLTGGAMQVEVLNTLSMTVPRAEIRDWLKDHKSLPASQAEEDALLDRLEKLSYEQLVRALETYLPNARK